MRIVSANRPLWPEGVLLAVNGIGMSGGELTCKTAVSLLTLPNSFEMTTE